MKRLLTFTSILIVVTHAAKLGKNDEIIHSSFELDADGSYSFEFETSGGIKVEESGEVKQIGDDPLIKGTVSNGTYSYMAPDGTFIKVEWVADENGFQPKGDHLPTLPSTSKTKKVDSQKQNNRVSKLV